MRIAIAAVGKLRNGPQAGLVDDYKSRIQGTGRGIGFSDFVINEVEAPKGLTGKKRQEKEGKLLLSTIAPASRRIVLDERGKNFKSSAFANKLAQWRDESMGATTFLIGGADGHDPSIVNNADVTMSFGTATWPHMLVRVMLCEQIYRAMTILANHPYHRE